MTTYHNAVSDKLVLFIDTDSSIYSIYSKDNQLKHQLVFDSDDSDSSFPKELSSAIFSSTNLQIINSKFTLCPLSEDKIDAFFVLNHGSGIDFLTAKNDTFKIGFEKPKLLDVLTDKLVNTNTATDIELLFDHISKKKHSHAIYFYEHKGILSLIAWKDGQFMLSNRYPVANADELFYFVMLVIEQLEIPVQDIHVECIASHDKAEEYKLLFKNYLPPIQQLAFSEETSSKDNTQVLSHFFAQCVL
tara:strand:- start:1582 stop:2319 length:738 start_codon:yes stop_codon:yes gene_type:complete